jgi:hypothetical protein
MSYFPPRILFRLHDRRRLSPLEALVLAEVAMNDGRCHDAERLIEIVYERIDSRNSPDPMHH